MVNINKCECDNHHLHLLLLLLLNTDKEKPTLIQILIASVVGVVIAELIQFRLRKCQKIVPHIKITDTGQVKLEKFQHYVGISYHNMYTIQPTMQYLIHYHLPLMIFKLFLI